MINLISVRKILTECAVIHGEIMAPRSQWSPNSTESSDMLNIIKMRQLVKNELSRNTQLKLAESLNISPTYLSLLLTGKRNPKTATDILERAIKFLN